MKAIISLAARMQSTRLPGKVLAEVAGKPILQHLVERLSRSKAEVVIANNGCDPEIRDLAKRLGVWCVAADVDVMAIHTKVADDTNADILCIAGADDPFLDPAIFDMVIDQLQDIDLAYVKTAGWPLGMNVWGLSAVALLQANASATAPDERQHVVPYFERRPNTYPQAVIRRPGEDLYSRFRLTVDNPSDLELTRRIYNFFGGDVDSTPALLDFLMTFPDIAAINADGLQGTAARDAIYSDLTPVDEPEPGPDLEAFAKWERFRWLADAALIREAREHVATERRAALASVPEQGEFAEGRAAAMLGLDQWLEYAASRSMRRAR